MSAASAFSGFPSSSKKSIYLRAPSPAAIATANAGFGGNSPDKVIEFTRHAIASAANIDILIVTVSQRYRGLIGPLLRSMLKLSSKLCAARKTLAGYHEDKTLERYPSFINGMHNPFKSIQPAGEARSHLASDITAANDWFREQKEEAFQKVLKLKEDEVAYLAKTLLPHRTD